MSGTRRGQAQLADRRLGAPAMQIPQGAGSGIRGAERQGVVEAARRAVRQPRIMVEAVEGAGPARQAQAHHRPQRDHERGGEEAEPQGAHQRRGVEPEAEPGDRQEDEHDGDRHPEQGPGLLPPERPAGAADEAVEAPRQAVPGGAASSSSRARAVRHEAASSSRGLPRSMPLSRKKVAREVSLTSGQFRTFPSSHGGIRSQPITSS